MHKAILINPTQMTIEMVQVGDYKTLQTLVGGNIEGVGYIQPNGVVGGYDDDFIYVNDEGLYDTDTDFVKLPNYAQVYYRGCMIITGSDGEGGTADVKMTLDQAAKFVRFVSKEMMRIMG